MLDLERTSSRSGCLTTAIWFGWVAVSMIGYLGGEWLGEAVETFILGPDVPRLLSIEGRVELAQPLSYLVSAIGGLVAGVVLGLAQGLLLLPYLKTRGMVEWVVVTTLGRMVRWVALFVIGQQLVALVVDRTWLGSCVLFGLLVGMGIIAGLALGYAQSRVLRDRVNRSSWWVLANLPGPVFTAIVIGLTLYIEGSNLVRD